MRRLTTVAVLLVVATALGLTVHRLTAPRHATPEPAINVVDALSGPTEGFARATAPRAFVFPDDHGPHPEFRTEWWYYTGNLATAAGRRFGYQLTFFRIGLSPPGEPRTSRWATGSAWMAHFALTDVERGQFVARSRLARGALELAGASPRPFRVWLEDWSVTGDGTTRLRASEGDVAIDLALVSAKPPVLHGDRGLSRKGREPGNASYYYSLTRLDTRGDVSIRGERHAVTGASWMDREWSTSALEPDQAGWDWFALHLDDGRELMLYQLRRADGSADPLSAGTLVARDGRSVSLDAGATTVDVLAWWTSPRDGTRYPSRWRVTVPAHGLTLELMPRLADQEWTEPVRYWEGAVAVAGTVSGQGYVELVGYASTTRAPLRTSPRRSRPRASVRP
jgi:predicted secreted hydrolase